MHVPALSKSLIGISQFAPEKILEKTCREWLARADVKINGKRAWDIQIHDPRFFRRVFTQGSLGLGESYMDGWWDCARLDEFFSRVIRAGLQEKLSGNWMSLLLEFSSRVANLQSPSRAWQVADQHYDIGNELYAAMLDSRMVYSCAYWKKAASLEEAQKAKLDLICRKLKLKPGMSLLDIGCGWGGLAKFAAEHYGVKVLGLTISKEQAKWAKQVCKGLPVEIRLQDYRELRENFDRVVSIGMFEHVGYKNYKTFMQIAHRCLKDDGLFLLHTIGSRLSVSCTDEWIDKYIFPNSMSPSAKQIARASEELWIMEDWHNFGADYDKTLMAWHANFCAHWEKLKGQYGPRFYRMWNYYLLVCAASFRSRKNQLWQIVFSKRGVEGGYASLR